MALVTCWKAESSDLAADVVDFRAAVDLFDRARVFPAFPEHESRYAEIDDE